MSNMYLSFIYIILIKSVIGDICNHISCPIFSFNQPPGLLKENASKIVKLGYINNDGSESQGYVMMAVANINNDSNLLPDIKFELYMRNFTDVESITIASLQICSIGVNAMIVNAEDSYVTASSTIALAYQVPTFNNRAESDNFIDKINYPMMSRIYPTSATMTMGMVTLIKKYGYSNVLALTTDGTGAIDTLESQAIEGGILNIFTVSIPDNPDPSEVASAVEACIGYINKYQIRPIIVATTTTSGWKLLAELSNKNIYGDNFIYILSHDMGRGYFILQYSNPMPILYPLLKGSIFLIARDTTGSPLMYKFYDEWKKRDLNYYPATSTLLPRSQIYVYDGVRIYAHALDLILKTGKSFNDVTTNDILSVIPNVTFNGVTGLIGFDENRDSLGYGGYYVYNLIDAKPINPIYVERGVYNPGNNSFTGPMNITFYNGGLIPPDPGYCEICVHGKCNSQSLCICDSGYRGEYCSEKIHENVNIAYYVPPVAVFVIIILIITIILFKRQRKRWIKKLYKEQASVIEKDEIKFLNEVGQGASGVVSKGIFRGTEVAIKSLITGTVSESILESFKYETSIMCSLRHTNIVLFMGGCFDEEESKLLLVMEFCSKGCLYDILNNKNCDLPIELLIHIASESASGMNFLHQSNFIHCDLKSFNILIDNRYTAKIADFGISKFKHHKHKHHIKSSGNNSFSYRGSGHTSSKGSSKNSNSINDMIGTVFWTAPEVLLGEPHTFKSDVYSFGIVLWELFHRKNPYPGKDLHAVAAGVALKGLRPEFNPNLPMPHELYNIMKSCQNQNPDDRPDFKTISNSLKHISLNYKINNLANYSIKPKSQSLPTGQVYLVESRITNFYQLFNFYPRAMQSAKNIHDKLIDENLLIYNGFLLKQKKTGILAAFSDCTDAVNWCIKINQSLNLTKEWPFELVNEIKSSNDFVLWSGLRIRISINVGNPDIIIDSNGINNYSGHVVDQTLNILKNTEGGSIIVTSRVAHDIEMIQSNLIEKVIFNKINDIEILTSLLPISLSERFEIENNFELPNKDEIPLTLINYSNLNYSNLNYSNPNWLIKLKDIQINEDIGKGQISTVKYGFLLSQKSIPVAIKILLNQNLIEDDYLNILADISIMTKMEHKNLLKIYGVCLKKNNLCIVTEYSNKDNLNNIILNQSINISLTIKHHIAKQISLGMNYLTNYNGDDKIRIHESFKTNNIFIMDDNFNIKIADYGQGRMKELARTMTSIGLVSYTAPEILDGSPHTIESSIYSFGIILWELYSRKIAYQNENVMKLVTKVLNGYRPDIKECPAVIQELIECCWNEDPLKRPTWNTIDLLLNHLSFNNRSSE